MDEGGTRTLSTSVRVTLVASLVLTAASVATTVAAMALDFTAADDAALILRTSAFYAALAATAIALVAALVIRAVYLRDPVTPQARTARALRLSAPPPTVEPGETGLRLPWALPVSVAASTFGIFFLSLVLHTLKDGPFDTTLAVVGCCTGLVPVSLGVVWWPLVTRAVRGGVSAGQVRRVGLTYLVAGATTGLVGGIAAAAGAVRETGLLVEAAAIVGLGGLLAWRGKVFYDFATRLRRNGRNGGRGRLEHAAS